MTRRIESAVSARVAPALAAIPAIPAPPAEVTEALLPTFARSPEMEQWLRDVWIDPDGPLGFTGDFTHLEQARIGVLFTNVRAPVPNGGGRITAGMAMIYAPRPGRRWMMAMQDAQMHGWFGLELPDFILIFDAGYWAAETVPVVRKLALTTHELCHCGLKLDWDGLPKLRKTGERRGEPWFALVPHAVEEFPLVVRWFGIGAASPGVPELIAAALQEPLMEAVVDEHWGCGSCLMAA